MALYLVTHVQLDGTGEVARVRWLTPDYSKNGFISKFEIVDVAEVVTAIERGDIVEMRFDGRSVLRRLDACPRICFRMAR